MLQISSARAGPGWSGRTEPNNAGGRAAQGRREQHWTNEHRRRETRSSPTDDGLRTRRADLRMTLDQRCHANAAEAYRPQRCTGGNTDDGGTDGRRWTAMDIDGRRRTWRASDVGRDGETMARARGGAGVVEVKAQRRNARVMPADSSEASRSCRPSSPPSPPQTRAWARPPARANFFRRLYTNNTKPPCGPSRPTWADGAVHARSAFLPWLS